MAEKVIDRFYEGPEPPERLEAEVIAFANAFPNATRAQWVEFASQQSGESYRSGFMRGFENAEREPVDPSVDPDAIADLLDPTWRDRAYDWKWDGGGIPLSKPEEVVRGEPLSEVESMEDMLQRFQAEGRDRT